VWRGARLPLHRGREELKVERRKKRRRREKRKLQTPFCTLVSAWFGILADGLRVDPRAGNGRKRASAMHGAVQKRRNRRRALEREAK